MKEEIPKLNITPRPDKITRDTSNKKENLSFDFSSILENTEKHNYKKAKKRLEILDKSEVIGNVYFNEENNSIQIKETMTNADYSGNNVGFSLYKELIRLAKEKQFSTIQSDSMVQRGAVIIWKKLKDEGYDITINSKVKEKYQQFIDTYNKGEYSQDYLIVSPEESVFKLNIKTNESN